MKLAKLHTPCNVLNGDDYFLSSKSPNIINFIILESWNIVIVKTLYPRGASKIGY